ncbi:extracellular solute-binding protein [Paenibacillus humicola]|uniref:extracellular solute-binding protein n=1 Tax=Paenibacillus humicola TaxID=3110540 RepID=UPI00237B9AE3|nr:extracellular solute-binding protein [Paenibacillus humicola]
MKHRKITIALLMTLVLGTLLSACGGSGGGNGDGNAASGGTDGGSKQEAPTTIKIMSDFTIAQPPSADNPVLKEFEKRTNTKLDITWVSAANSSDYLDRLNVVLSSGDLPDLLKLDDVTNPLFQQMVKQGAFWDLSPFLSSYPNLMEYPKSVWDNTKIDGKNYVIPVARPLNGFVFVNVRKDWLDKLGLPVPKTIDDFYNMLKAFKEKKPDGKTPTYGYTMRGSDVLDGVFTGSNGRWKDVGGKLIDANFDPGMRESILFKHKLYAEGLVPPDYAVMKDSQYWDMATSGSAGSTAETIEAQWRWTYDQWKRDPKVDWLPLSSLSYNGVPYVPQYRGYIGVLAIPKKVPEEKVKKILSLLDFGASEEGGTLALYGIKGVHYNEENGIKVTTEKAVQDSVGVGAFGKIFMHYDPYMYAFAPGMTKEVFERNKQVIDERAKVAKPDVAIGLVSQTDIKMGADYTKKMNDMKTQVIMGKAKIEDWDKLIQSIQNDPTYQQITKEINEAYQARLAQNK